MKVLTKETRLMVKGGRNSVGYGIGFVAAGESGIKVYGGPEVPGPWAFAFPLAAVIAANPNFGTGAEIDRAQAAGLLVEASFGDLVSIDGHTYRLANRAAVRGNLCGDYDVEFEPAGQK